MTWPIPGAGAFSGGSAFPPCTMQAGLQTAATTVSSANVTMLFRSMGVGTITGIALIGGTVSGNIAVGIYQSPGGGNTTNLVRVTTSGSVPMSTIGNPISIPSTQVNLNSYFALWCDNMTATFFCGGTGNAWAIVTSGAATGLCAYDNTSIVPIPINPIISGWLRGGIILMTGVS